MENKKFILPNIKIVGHISESILKIQSTFKQKIHITRDCDFLDICYNNSENCHTCCFVSKEEENMNHVCNDYCVPKLENIKPIYLHFLNKKEKNLKIISIKNCTIVQIIPGTKTIDIVF